jgi:SAM-dependent methyltransferase
MSLLGQVKQQVPWQLKVASKLVLSRLPVRYRTWQVFQLFRHGAMDDPSYAYRVFKEHFDRSDFARKQSGFVSLELGPGDSLFSCVCAKAYGGSQTWLVDSGPFAERSSEGYKKMSAFLAAQGFAVPISGEGGLEGVLKECGAHYGTRGLDSLREIPTASVDWIWSHAVLEHVRRSDFDLYISEMRRILRPDGICSHRVDLRDHLGGALNNLRFSDSLWERDWIARSGFYTNRLQFDEMCAAFAENNFKVDVINVERWPTLPTPRSQLADEFKEKSETTLLVRGFDVLLRPQ